MSIIKGKEVNVLFVPPQDAKRWKTWLTQHGRLHPDVRLHPVGTRIAIPVLDSSTADHEELQTVERGTCFCPYRSSMRGNPQMQQNATQRVWHDFVQSLCPDASFDDDALVLPPPCPAHFELMGDDRTVVVPHHVWKPEDWTVWMQQQQQQCHPPPEWTPPSILPWDRLWQALAQLYSSRRVVRRGTIDPNNRVRHSTYQVLWHDGSYTADPGWITVTEQGIRQSYDLTQVMFSRGNISEKIRFGQTLVQPGDDVLDLYAGIGYFTLPALVHGRARHVVACEWNPEALRALQYNVVDNGVSERVTIVSGDGRTAPWGPQRYSFDRVSLGLLPSSQGGWKTAVRALKPNTGGWLHIHANVPVVEVQVWGKWLCVQLQSYVVDESWRIVLQHMQTVKSFAPTVNHYVADVCLGPIEIVAQRTQRKEVLWLSGCCRMAMMWQGVLTPVEEPVAVPSCALSDTGVLHQEWMRELMDP